MPIWERPFAGFANFVKAFEDRLFKQTMINTLGISILQIAVGTIVAILFAVLLNEISRTMIVGRIPGRVMCHILWKRFAPSICAASYRPGSMMVLSWFSYIRGIKSSDYGLGTALGVFQSIVGVTLLMIANKIASLVGPE